MYEYINQIILLVKTKVYAYIHKIDNMQTKAIYNNAYVHNHNFDDLLL